MSRTARRVLAATALLASLAVAAIFATRAVDYGKRTQSEVETIRPWMSVPYIAHSRHVPQRLLWEALGIPPHAHDHRPLMRIARDKRQRVEDLIALLRGVIKNTEHKPGLDKPHGRETPP